MLFVNYKFSLFKVKQTEVAGIHHSLESYEVASKLTGQEKPCDTGSSSPHESREPKLLLSSLSQSSSERGGSHSSNTK